ncbi:uncharacterized protein LOC121377595 [Gigantopelta aegis]|uniref:uncharacterized protein LOC121377595 n=1 Tax=Gigantopelta aegis TaxID=1735272 RepID=UPI001B88DC42|nr:uncharacterized protein LOC121377595 [Gigantopelta aegis]
MKKTQEAWASITSKINAVTVTCVRTSDEVKKRWQDAQCSVKKKESMRVKESGKTGGGPAPEVLFKPWELIVLRTLSATAIVGIECGVDTGKSEISLQSTVSQELSTSVKQITEGFMEEKNISIHTSRTSLRKDHDTALNTDTHEQRECKRSADQIAEQLLHLKRQKLDNDAAYRQQHLQLQNRIAVSLEKIANALSTSTYSEKEKEVLSVTPIIEF